MADNDKMVLVSPETRFKRNAKALLGLFIEFFQGLDEDDCPDMTHINLAYTFLRGQEKELLITSFIINTNDQWKELKTKNNEYLLKNIINLTSERYRKKLRPYVDASADKKGELLLDKEAIEAAWEYTHNLVKCSIHYLHDNKGRLNNSELNNYDTWGLAKDWGVDLKKKFYEEGEENSDEDSG